MASASGKSPGWTNEREVEAKHDVRVELLEDYYYRSVIWIDDESWMERVKVYSFGCNSYVCTAPPAGSREFCIYFPCHSLTCFYQVHVG